MSESIRLYAGRIIPAKQFAEHRQTVSEISESRETAAQILADAEAEAAKIVAAAKAHAADVEMDVQRIADDQLMRFVDEGALDGAAKALQEMLTASAKLRGDFAAFTPWMKSFVYDAVTRITGEMPQEDMWLGVIRQGLEDVQDRWNLTLRVHPSHAPLLEEVIKADPTLRAAFKDVQPNRALKRTECFIEGSQGVTDISVQTQLTALLIAMEKAVEVPVGDDRDNDRDVQALEA